MSLKRLGIEPRRTFIQASLSFSMLSRRPSSIQPAMAAASSRIEVKLWVMSMKRVEMSMPSICSRTMLLKAVDCCRTAAIEVTLLLSYCATRSSSISTGASWTGRRRLMPMVRRPLSARSR
ncbi:hypothetical protein D9M71_363960 [compost metagenome]